VCGGRPTAACPPNQGTCRRRAAPAAECHWPAWRPPACSACRPWASAAWSCRSCSLPPQICVARTNFFAQIKNRTTQPTRICSRKKKELPHRAGVIDAYFGLAPSIATAAAGGLCSSEPVRWVASAQGRDWEGRSSRCVGVGRCEQQQSTAQPWWSLGGRGGIESDHQHWRHEQLSSVYVCFVYGSHIIKLETEREEKDSD
jgi:hypothetical protein